MTARTETADFDPHPNAACDARNTDRMLPLATVRGLALEFDGIAFDPGCRQRGN